VGFHCCAAAGRAIPRAAIETDMRKKRFFMVVSGLIP
jgi:hypothetical protein